MRRECRGVTLQACAILGSVYRDKGLRERENKIEITEKALRETKKNKTRKKTDYLKF